MNYLRSTPPWNSLLRSMQLGAVILLLLAFTIPPRLANATPQAAAGGVGIWLSQAEIDSLPMSGSGWTQLKAAADGSTGTPDLSNQDSEANVNVLAKALVYARTRDPKYGNEVVAALRIITLNNTESGGRTLALGRELAAYVIAADLINLASYDPSLDGQFRQKLRELLTKPLDSSTLIETHQRRPNNWGTHAGASRAAVAAYLGDMAELARTATVFRGWLGDLSAYRSFSYGDLAWQADPQNPVGINPPGATKDGHSIDGALPEEMRRGGGFQWPPASTNYAWGGLQGAIVQAEILHRAGYPAWEWQDRALLRAANFLKSIGWQPVSDDAWQAWLINDAYGQTVLAADSEISPGKNMGWTNWTHARSQNPPSPNPTPTRVPSPTPNPSANQPPTVNAGTDQTIALPNQAVLVGSANDDKLPNPPGALTLRWSKTSGPGTVVFADDTDANTTASFSSPGNYVLRLTANDGAATAYDELAVAVVPAAEQPPGVTIQPIEDAHVTSAKPTANYGTVNTLRLRGGSNPYRSYLKFNLSGLAGSVQSAKLRLYVTDANGGESLLHVVDNEYIGVDTPWEEEGLTWNNAPPVTGSPVATVAQAVQDAWVEFDVTVAVAGNGIYSFALLGSSNDALAYASKERSATPPQLVITLATGSPGNQPPSVDAGADQRVAVSTPVNLQGTVNDDGLPASGNKSIKWQVVQGPGTVTFATANAAATTATFSAPGIYVLELSASDGELTSRDRVTIAVDAASGTLTLESLVIAGSDDAEENTSGKVVLNSGRLELIHAKTDQTIGLRFRRVDIPPGAIIVNAYVQFRADKRGDEATSLVLQGELANKALTFTAAPNNVSNRPRTAASVPWSPAAWTETKQAGVDQRTPNLAAVIQEIVNQPGWARGNPLALIITGTGKRVAEAYEGGATKAPRLYIEYTVANVQAASEYTTEDTPVEDQAETPEMEGTTEPALDEEETEEETEEGPEDENAQNHAIYLPLVQR